ncbi:response regulator [Virgibacillus halodenitrificans]|uniref:Heme response regulator HssR n=1 Tax=Virgibacillus halodenitrificans TaxID=1482 RepID=A0AAC9NIB5_VIRHA|nr:response regulator transcription factor [Virgibacillus halodenitrificans]APC46897.1 DNA-binding response regulator [Virgibacillus halodenitrificans]MCG1027513.1 response regulator transcription factor [Virgibacillus halodenitrificans]MCJ0930185.1 response regulator transcription factor [Virgibacillus halodenitrificans]MEC2159268.1 response regulator transcription factor [Virgibacillus halodenitrificans]MYL47555.1 response regulator [Virgibacillus halodenitrificans]
MITILIVDDDPHIRELLRFYLQKEGYQTEQATDGNEALKILELKRIHLALVDIMMPNMDGYELCKEIRDYYDIPVMMLTAKGEITDKEKAFLAGTDDYIVKPFEPKEVLYRIKALLRRFQMVNEEVIHLGNTVINRRSYEVTYHNKNLILPLKEFELLAQLASYPNRIFSREQLIELVWGSDYEGNDRTVDVHIKRLRERFAEEEQDFSIQTVRGLGYKLEMKQ